MWPQGLLIGPDEAETCAKVWNLCFIILDDVGIQPVLDGG